MHTGDRGLEGGMPRSERLGVHTRAALTAVDSAREYMDSTHLSIGIHFVLLLHYLHINIPCSLSQYVHAAV